MTASRKSLSSLPGDFTERIRGQFPDEHGEFLRALEQEPVTAIRLNPHKSKPLPEPSTMSPGPAIPEDYSSPEDFPCSGDAADSSGHATGTPPRPFPGMRPVPWSDNGWFLPERPSFTLDPLFHAGSYYVQEAASMFLERVLSKPAIRDSSEVILDACAAPGGKTTLIAARFPESLVVANEVIRSRVPALMENSIKWGTGNIAITRSDTARLGRLTSFFDLVVVDAPCSGEGLFRKDPASRSQWSNENARHCSLRQQSILSELWEAVRPGGYLIYTTCTFNPEENERNVARFLEKTGGECLKMPPGELYYEMSRSDRSETVMEISSGAVTGYGFYPHRTMGEGFFLTVIRKPASGTSGSSRTNATPQRRSTKAVQIAEPASSLVQKVSPWFTGGAYDWFRIGDRMHRIHSRHLAPLHSLSSAVSVLYAGTEAGKVIRDEIRPSPAAALDIHLNKKQFPQITCTREEALRFLRRDHLPVPPDTEKGWHLATYRGLPLGWLKNIGNRMNNYHPKEWRIRI